MANKKDVINLTDKDYVKKSFKTAPPGKYLLLITQKTKLKPGQKSNGILAQLKVIKGEHKGVTALDNLQAHVGWKIAQLILALGLKKKTKLTIPELLKLIVGKKVRAVLTIDNYNGKKSNKVAQYLPVHGSAATRSDDDESSDDDEEDDGDDEAADDEDAEDAAEDSEDSEDADDDDDDDEGDGDDDEDAADEDEDDGDSDDSDDDDETSDDSDEDSDESDDDGDEEEEPRRKKKKVKAKAAPAKAKKKSARKK